MAMHSRSVQAPAAVVMIRPGHFVPNPETAADNAFQMHSPDMAGETISAAACLEFDRAVNELQAVGIEVHAFEDQCGETPDSVFPNNWFSTHSGGHVAIYPMYTPNRRKERRSDIIEMLKCNYRVQDVIDYSGMEHDGLFLEGTGAMVLDHVERVAYAARSMRTSEILLERFCAHFNFEPLVFDAADAHGRSIYHTNVLMCIGTHFSMIGLDCVTDATRRAEVAKRLEGNGRDVVALTQSQIAHFAGNAIELHGTKGSVIALSKRALEALDAAQRQTLERHGELLPLEISTIELAGGSVRCMLAGVHLSKRN